MNRNRVCRVGLVGVLLCTQANVIAGDVVPYQEYGKYVDKHRTIEALDSSLFGEQVNLRDGGVSFRVVDAELAGIGPTMRIVRSFRIKESAKTNETTGNGLGEWELEIPRLKTITANELGTRGESPFGWQVPGANRNARCASFAAPGPISFWDAARHWEASEWWSGYQVVDEAGTSQEVLRTSSLYTAAAGSKGITSGNWKFTCLAATANGEPGDAFLATAPDGTRYWFNYLVYTTADTLNKPLWGVPPVFRPGSSESSDPADPQSSKGPPTPDAIAQDELKRRYGAMLVTRIEDRFGNWLTYQYSSGLLTRIDASDGRILTVSRASSSVAVSLGSINGMRTWTYALASNGLTGVTLPDGSAWSYSFGTLSNASPIDDVTYRGGSCSTLLADLTGPGTLVGSVTAPSGATATYTFAVRHFGRSYVYRECWGGDPGTTEAGYALTPADWLAYALTQRSLSGPGITMQSWTYAYSPANASWTDSCAGGCTTEIWTDVTAPDGVRQRSTFSNRYNETENLLLKEDTYSSTNALVRSILHANATYPVTSGTPYPWPDVIGDDLQLRTNKARSERWAPAQQRQIQQQGRTFTWQVPTTCGPGGTSACFDAFARPIKVTKTSSP